MLVAIWKAGDPTRLGWLTFGLYLLATLICFRRALAQGERRPWGWQSAALLFLGLNKELDLQTVLIRLSRQCARATGWFAYRRAVEFALFLAVLFVLLWAVTKWSRQIKAFARAHPVVLHDKRLIVPLYSDGFSFSLMAITDDWGQTWFTSTPLVGGGNIQPSIVEKRDGTLFTLMRDNGPAPKRLHASQSTDQGKTWSKVVDSAIPNPGSGAEVIKLSNGHWVLIHNDTERGRNSLAVAISDDEGASWRWKRHLEYDPPAPEAGAFHYPSIIQARDGSLHATYSYHLNKKDVANDGEGQPARKSIKHAHFNEQWVMLGDPK